jgi:ABC-type dipeptide/oligopeptide/nickel transport system permease component
LGIFCDDPIQARVAETLPYWWLVETDRVAVWRDAFTGFAPWSGPVRRDGAAREVTGYALRRLAVALLTVWIAATLAFLLVHLAPGDRAVALGGESGAAEQVEAVARAYGLDRPLRTIYLDWLGRLVSGDLGHSYRVQEAVATLIVERLPVTLALMLPALVLSTVFGVAIGLWAAASEWQQKHATSRAT